MSSLGSQGEGDRDHHPLAHPAAELVGIARAAARGVGDADQLEQLDRPLLGAPRA